MKKENFAYPTRWGTLAGKTWGNGRQLLLCLHGYGNNRHLFDGLLLEMEHGYRVVSIDLPLFGESIYTGSEPLSELDLTEIINLIQTHFPHDSCTLLGFSLGAKLGIGLIQTRPKFVQKSILIAPDGLKIHPMYKFCIYNPVGSKLFRWTVRRPGFFLFVLRSLYKFRIADAFKYRFVKGQFADENRRNLLQRVWSMYAEIRVNTDQLAHDASKRHQLEWHLVWGTQDNILPVKIGRDFAQKVPGTQLHTLEAGHLLLKTHRRELQSLLKNIL